MQQIPALSVGCKLSEAARAHVVARKMQKACCGGRCDAVQKWMCGLEFNGGKGSGPGCDAKERRALCGEGKPLRGPLPGSAGGSAGLSLPLVLYVLNDMYNISTAFTRGGESGYARWRPVRFCRLLYFSRPANFPTSRNCPVYRGKSP